MLDLLKKTKLKALANKPLSESGQTKLTSIIFVRKAIAKFCYERRKSPDVAKIKNGVKSY